MKKIFALFAILVLLTSFVIAEDAEPELYEDDTEAGVTPDSLFYGLDRAMERISLALTFNKAKKTEKGLKYAEERLMEVKQMIEENKVDKAVKAQEHHAKALERAKEALGKVKDPEDVEQLKNKVQSHYEKVVQIKNTILERQREIMSEEQIAKLEEVFGKIKERAQEMETKVEEKQEEVGKPEEAGKPEEVEEKKPEEAGKPEDAGKEDNFDLLVSDLPADIGDFDSLVVEFSEARIFKGGKPVEESIEGESADLTELVGEKAVSILSTYLEPGRYNKIELHVSSVEGIVNGTSVDVDVPSNKLMITKNFDVVEGEETKFVFDINVVKKGQGGYNLLPQISESGVVGKDLDEDEVDEVEEDECSDEIACEEGFECVNGECEEIEAEEEPECSDEIACEEGFECVNGECEEIEVEVPDCTLDTDCGVNETCVEGECEST